MATPTTPTETLTFDMISALGCEADAAGDDEMGEICDDALDMRIAESVRRICLWDCAAAINSARAMDDSTPYVRVVVA